MNDSEDILAYSKLQRLIAIFQRLQQVSWTSDQTKKRYPYPEAMTPEEISNLTKFYLALGFDIEDIYKDWKKEYENKI